MVFHQQSARNIHNVVAMILGNHHESGSIDPVRVLAKNKRKNQEPYIYVVASGPPRL
jgi:hypothetical protein